MSHPESVALDIPAQDGTLLRVTLHRDEPTGRFVYDSLLEVQKHTSYGLRPLASYRAGAVMRAPRMGGLELHDEDFVLRIESFWLIHLGDWISLMTEASIDAWKAVTL